VLARSQVAVNSQPTGRWRYLPARAVNVDERGERHGAGGCATGGGRPHIVCGTLPSAVLVVAAARGACQVVPSVHRQCNTARSAYQLLVCARHGAAGTGPGASHHRRLTPC
jgi:hypothetical protein